MWKSRFVCALVFIICMLILFHKKKNIYLRENTKNVEHKTFSNVICNFSHFVAGGRQAWVPDKSKHGEKS